MRTATLTHPPSPFSKPFANYRARGYTGCMAEQDLHIKDMSPTHEPSAEEDYRLSVALVREVDKAIDEEDFGRIRDLIFEMHAADLAELFNVLTGERRERLLSHIGAQFDPEVLTYLKPGIREDIIEHLGVEKSAEVIAQLDTDDAVHVIEDLSAADQQEILESVPEEAREDIIESLTYPESSAGRLMRPEFVSVPEFWTVGDAIDHLRGTSELPDDFYVLFVMDPRFRPIGTVMLSRVMQNRRETRIKDIMNLDIHTIPTNLDQEEVANIFRKYALVEAPVVNDDGRLVGVVTVDDVVDVIQEEGEEDIMRMGGVANQDFHAPILETARRRFLWLFINLLTAILASWVIGRFEGSIQKIVALAVLMPIIASMGGNAGIQTVTVAVRAITTRQLQSTNALAVLWKEIIVGGVNGMLMGIITGAGVAMVFGNGRLALVFAAAMMMNMIMAGFCGVLIPLLFQRLKLDPAITSGVFLTMFTDITGFLSFLGLATFVLLAG